MDWENYFNKSKYTRAYFKIIARSQTELRKKHQGVYYEAHHVIPKSIKGNNYTVLLTAKEHFICHLLLTRMCLKTKDTYRMLNAFQMMSQVLDIGRTTASIYAKLKPRIAAAKSVLCSGEQNPFYGRTHSPETRARIQAQLELRDMTGKNNPNYGNRWSDEQKSAASDLKSNISEETRQRMRLSQLGKIHTSEHRHKVRMALIGRPVSEETREKVRVSKLGNRNPNYGRKYDEDYKSKMSESLVSLKENIVRNKSIYIYKRVFFECGKFTESAVAFARESGIISKHSVSYFKVVSVLSLTEQDEIIQKEFEYWKGKRSYIKPVS